MKLVRLKIHKEMMRQERSERMLRHPIYHTYVVYKTTIDISSVKLERNSKFKKKETNSIQNEIYESPNNIPKFGTPIFCGSRSSGSSRLIKFVLCECDPVTSWGHRKSEFGEELSNENSGTSFITSTSPVLYSPRSKLALLLPNQENLPPTSNSYFYKIFKYLFATLQNH